ncbi:MAG: esterase family protein [Acidobacteriia bacterium]|nr:esterase family protein [Terriglobia bacterium]
MKRAVLFAIVAAILAAEISLAQGPPAQAPAGPTGAAAQAAGRGRGGFGPPPELGPDDKQAFPDAPAGFNLRRDDIPHGTLTEVPYDSKTLGTRRQIGVYLPPGYSPGRKYPTLYLIHGLGWNNREWTAIRHVEVVLENLIADGKVQPMVLIFPNGDSTMTLADIEAVGANPRMNSGNAQHPAGAPAVGGDAAPAGAGGAGATAGRGGRQGMSMEPWLAPFENDLMKDIIPFVDSHYSVYSDPGHRALAGLSMGGGQALNIGIVHPETFAYVGGFSAAPDTKRPEELVPDPEVPKKLKLLWVACGNKDGLLRVSQGVHAYLKEKGVPHIWNVDGNAHDTPEWQNNFYHFSQRIFK